MSTLAVLGLWHLGCVTAAAVASRGILVRAYDPDRHRIAELQKGHAPLFEPGLNELIQREMQLSHLSFSTEAETTLTGAEWIWLTVDTPVGSDGKADVAALNPYLKAITRYAKAAKGLIISSQVPAGYAAQVEKKLRAACPNLRICYSPENLRLGKALDVFLNPDRLIAGVRSPEDRSIFEFLFQRITPRIEWMRTESAEMAKHAINAFLAASVVFTNELARLCEASGASAFEVERALKTESRIGPKAYVRPGGPMAGGTLERDVHFLTDMSRRLKVPTSLFPAILESNKRHMNWVQEKLKQHLKKSRKTRVALLGLTYKEGTDTLRRSSALTLAKTLRGKGIDVTAYDPQLSVLPTDARRVIQLHASPAQALQQADAAVVMTDHSAFRSIPFQSFQGMRGRLLLDPNGTLRERRKEFADMTYVTLGAPERGLA